MTENLLISTVGVLLGAVLTIALNMFLVETFDLDSVSMIIMVPVAMLLLIGVGQLASFGPARRAASVPPAVATRTI